PGMTCGERYATDLFERAGAEQLTVRLLRLIQGLVASPDAPVDSIDLMDTAERERLDGWNDTAHVLDGPANLAELVAAGATSPKGPALVFEGEELSRTDFDARVNRLARLLVRRGVGPESVVGVALPRSFDLLVSLHAVVRAGGAYLPLDLTLPADRLTHMTDTAAPVCVLTDLEWLGALPLACEAEPVVLDAPEIRAELEELPDAEVTDADRLAPLLPHHPAYVIFTSGSTGRPKGVMVEHRAIVNRLEWMQHTYLLDGTDRVLQKTPTSFDVSVWELFWPLAQGIPLVIARPEGHKDPEYLAELIRTQRVTVLHFVPSMLAAFVAEVEVSSCPSLRVVVCSGEALPSDLVARFHASAGEGSVALENLYGPTEAAVDVTAASCPPEGSTGASASIGSPVWNTRVHVLDERLRPVPVGVPGELYLAGVQLARGYLSRPDLTAERFVADPHGPTGTRMYRTGDLAVRRHNGTLDYLGRADDQVKLRGFRIELGEIDTVLTTTPGILRAVTVIREDRPGSRRLVAYAVPAAGASFDPDALRAHATTQLPEYMVPSVFMEIPAIPLSPNGKLDRRALPAPPDTVTGPSRAPRDAREEILAGTFAAVLGLDTAGVDDDFFSLGGHSLLAARAAARVRAALGVECSVRDVFEARTVEALAARLAARGASGRPALARVGARPEPTPLSYAQRRLWLIDSVRGPGTAYNVPLAVRLDGPVNPTAASARGPICG
ncbi:amino acid adenylation domain-containing protein, partial [Streptomyces massasporeus]